MILSSALETVVLKQNFFLKLTYLFFSFILSTSMGAALVTAIPTKSEPTTKAFAHEVNVGILQPLSVDIKEYLQVQHSNNAKEKNNNLMNDD